MKPLVPVEKFRPHAAVFKALGHPARLLMVDALRNGELCVCDLQDMVGSDMSTVSRHLSVLRTAGVVESRREGTNIYYRLSLPCVPGMLDCLGGGKGNRHE